jgi:hypothetical protein
VKIEREDEYDPIVTERSVEYDGFKAIARTETNDRDESQFTFVFDEDGFTLFGVYGNPDERSLHDLLSAYVNGYRNGIESGRNEVRSAIKNALGVR